MSVYRDTHHPVRQERHVVPAPIIREGAVTERRAPRSIVEDAAAGTEQVAASQAVLATSRSPEWAERVATSGLLQLLAAPTVFAALAVAVAFAALAAAALDLEATAMMGAGACAFGALAGLLGACGGLFSSRTTLAASVAGAIAGGLLGWFAGALLDAVVSTTVAGTIDAAVTAVSWFVAAVTGWVAGQLARAWLVRARSG
ncbi:MAG TPA: hypothetical protein VMY78_06180 [Solirubrobacteraceae bacterium]|nr:hypothetical protein [Solirubrobacteraceae bacterium]